MNCPSWKEIEEFQVLEVMKGKPPMTYSAIFSGLHTSFIDCWGYTFLRGRTPGEALDNALKRMRKRGLVVCERKFWRIK